MTKIELGNWKVLGTAAVGKLDHATYPDNLDIFYFDIVEDYPSIGGVAEFSRLLFRELKRRYGARLHSVRELAPALGLPGTDMPYLHRERMVAERLASRHPSSVFFFPNFQSPVPGYARDGGPRVVNVVHDVQFAYLPELFSRERLGALYRTFAETRDNADEVVFISEAARQQFLDVIGAPRRHRVIYNPIAAAKSDRPDLEAAARRPFLLASLHHHPHKNFAGLLTFFARLAEGDPDLELVMTGHGGARVARLLADLPAPVRCRVRHLGYVGRRRLDELYRRARAFVSLSRFEGFNMSAAEAALHGTPLLLSDLPVHRELYAGLACLLDPHSPSVEAAQAYLAERARNASPVWPLQEICRPARVGAAYGEVLDAHVVAAGASCGRPWRGDIVRASSRRRGLHALPLAGTPLAGRGRRLAASLLAGTLLAGSAAALCGLGATTAHADGGAGGGRGQRVVVDNTLVYYIAPGPAGGTGYTGENAEDASSTYFGGGGGGAGGGAGADGAPCGGTCGVVGTPGAGGAGGTAGHPDGYDGQPSIPGPTYASGGGAGGGGGGYHGNGFSGALTGGDLTGGNGGRGGDGPVAAIGAAGGGGAGGYGALITATGGLNNAATITGGRGGDGGTAIYTGNQGGGGGDGGVGAYFAEPGAVFTNTGAILGGDGGIGGAGPAGTGGYAGLDFNGANGAGGAGVVGAGLTLINGGTISGGLGGDGATQASAVAFLGGVNAITFLNGTSGLVGAIELQNAAEVTFAQPTDVVVDNMITGTGTLRKTGAGELNLTGDSAAFTGAMTVAAGRLALNGALGGEVEVLAGAVLGGNGTAGALTVHAGGTVAPGNSIGTLHVAGDVTLEAGSTYEVEFLSGGASDRIEAGGTATIEGAGLRLVSLDPRLSYRTAQSFSILEAATIEGSFGSVSGVSRFMDVDIQQSGTSIDVVLSVAGDAFERAAATGNQLTTASALGTLPQFGPMLGLYNSVLFLPTTASAREAFDLLSGEVHASAQSLFVEESGLVRNALIDRLRASQGAVGASGAPVMSYAAPSGAAATPAGQAIEAGMPVKAVAAPAVTPGPALWATGFGSWTEFDGTGNAAGLSGSTGGFLIGADTALAGGWRLGLAGGYSATSFDIGGRGASGDSDNWHIGVYGGNQWGALALRAGLAYTWQDVSTTRTVVFPGYADSLSADYNAGLVQAFGELGYRLDTAFASFEPFANLAYVSLDSDGYGETGGAAALTGTGSDMDTTFTTLGVRLEKDVTLGSVATTLRGTLGWRHAFGDLTPVATQAFLGSAAFAVTGVPIAEDAAVVQAGLDVELGTATTLGVAYDGQFGDGVTQNGFNATLKVQF